MHGNSKIYSNERKLGNTSEQTEARKCFRTNGSSEILPNEPQNAHVLTLVSLLFPVQYFTGNRDQNTIVSHAFIPALRCRYVRVHPWGWYRHISMRLEFYGCLTGKMNKKVFLFPLEKHSNFFKT